MDKLIKLDGVAFNLTSDDQTLIDAGDDFEPCMVDLFKALIKPTDVIVDIGGNIGLTSILFSRKASKVYTFEPSPSTFALINEKLKRAEVNNVETFNLGLGQENETMTITFSKSNRTGGFISNKISPPNHITEKITITTFDGFSDKHFEKIDLIKIDVEGYEMNVIKGGLNAINKFKPTIVLEINHFCLNVLHRISVPDYLDYLLSVFPYLYAVDADNCSIVDLHDEENLYHVMYEHVVNKKYPNLVAGFSDSIAGSLNKLSSNANNDS